jgi:hypothetical protein
MIKGMTTAEFEAIVAEGGQIALPPELVSRIPAGEQLRVLVMWDVADAEAAWRAQGQASFRAAYSSEDSVYEQLIDDAPVG